MDSKSTNIRHRRTGEKAWGQDIPNVHSFENKAGPPILPPHLLQVILNKVHLSKYSYDSLENIYDSLENTNLFEKLIEDSQEIGS